MLSASGTLQANWCAPTPPTALVVPHAGYVYSGTTAGRAYAELRPWAAEVERVVVLGPSHRVAFAGVALPDADAVRAPTPAIQKGSIAGADTPTPSGFEPERVERQVKIVDCPRYRFARKSPRRAPNKSV